MNTLEKNYSITDEYHRMLENQDNFIGKEVILMTCPKCGGTLLKKLSDGTEVALECECMAKNRVNKKIKKFQHLSISDRNSGQDTFKHAVFSCVEEEKLFKQMKKYVLGFKLAMQENAGLLFIGKPGTGKTFTANCIVNYLKANGYTVLSFSLAGYFRKIRDSYSSKEGNVESDLLKAVKEADLLFLDDLGSEIISEGWGKEKLFSLIDERYRANKPIIVTTNLDMTELEELLKFNNVDKITDRLCEMTTVVPFTWNSKRKKMKKYFWEE